MSEAKVIFTLDGVDLTIQCSSDDKMSVICQKYAKTENKNIDTLLFLYEGVIINFELNFKEQANSLDNVNKQMKILVYQNKNEKKN